MAKSYSVNAEYHVFSENLLIRDSFYFSQLSNRFLVDDLRCDVIATTVVIGDITIN